MPQKSNKQKIAHAVLKWVFNWLVENIDLEKYVKENADGMIEKIVKTYNRLDDKVQERILDPIKKAIEKATDWNI